MLQLSMTCGYSAVNNAQGLRLIVVVAQLGSVKIYVAAVEALRKKERQDETQFTTQIDGFLSFIPPWMLMFFFAGLFLISPCAIRIKTLGKPNSGFLVLCFSYFTDNSIDGSFTLKIIRIQIQITKIQHQRLAWKKTNLQAYTQPLSPLNIRWGASQVQFFVLQWANLVDPSLKPKKKTMEAPQSRNSTAKIGCHYFWPWRIALPKNTLNWRYLFCFILISWGCLRSPTLFLQWAYLIGPSQQKKIETMEVSQNRRFYGDGMPPPSAHLHWWEGEDFGQNLWD